MYSEQERLDFLEYFIKNDGSIALTARKIPKRSFFKRIERDLTNQGVVRCKREANCPIFLTEEMQ